MRVWTVLSMAALASLTPLTGVARAAPKTSYVYGPAPDWEEYQRLGNAAVRAQLPDPSQWTIEWPNGYVAKGWSKKGLVSGYTTCGMVRSVQPVTHGSAIYLFAIVIDYGEVKTLDLELKSNNRLVDYLCPLIIRQGQLPPASMMPVGTSSTINRLGVAVRTMPDGAYVTSVVPNSPAARAGITTGTVITRVNGIAVAGMGPAMAKILDSDAATLAVETATGQHIEIKQAR